MPGHTLHCEDTSYSKLKKLGNHPTPLQQTKTVEFLHFLPHKEQYFSREHSIENHKKKVLLKTLCKYQTTNDMHKIHWRSGKEEILSCVL